MSMKENYNVAVCDSKCLRKEEDPLSFEGKGIYELHDSGGLSNPVAFDVNGSDGHWRTKVSDDFSNDKDIRTLDSLMEGLNGHAHDLDGWKSASLFLTETRYGEKPQISPDTGFCMVDDLIPRKLGESRKSSSVHITISDLFDMDADLYSDKNISECEKPDATFSYEEVNCNAVKDIRVDDGLPTNERSSQGSCKDGHSVLSFPQQSNHDHLCDCEGVAVESEAIISDGSKAASLGIAHGIDNIICANKEAGHDKLQAQFRQKLGSEGSFDNVTVHHNDPEDSIHGGVCKIVSHASDEGSLVVRVLPIQEFGTRSFLRSFLSSLECEEKESSLSRDHGLFGKKVRGNHESLSLDVDPNENDQPRNIIYNSKMESGSITFNFKYTEGEESGMTDDRINKVKEQSDEPVNVHTHRDGIADITLDSNLVQFISISDNTTADAGQDPRSKNDISDGSSDSDRVPCLSCKGSRIRIAEGDSLNDKSNDHSTNEEIQILKNEEHLLKHDYGESSFSAAGLISFSGSVAYSGSLSLRSDGSTTSGRSFAFPILHSECISSPVRMAKADRKHFRRHKGWRSGLLCCRF